MKIPTSTQSAHLVLDNDKTIGCISVAFRKNIPQMVDVSINAAHMIELHSSQAKQLKIYFEGVHIEVDLDGLSGYSFKGNDGELIVADLLYHTKHFPW